MDNNVNENEELDQERNNETVEDPASEKQSRLSKGLNKASDFINDYRQNGSLAGMAKEALNNKIHDKVDAKKNEIKDKAKQKIDDKKQQIKDKVDSKLPDSVKQKRDSIKNKGQDIKNKLNAPKNKANELKEKLKEVNEKSFKKAAKATTNMVAPGMGTAAEQILNTPLGAPALEEARSASNPLSAISKGSKKLAEITVKMKVATSSLKLIPIFLVLFIVIFIVFGIATKFHDSLAFFSNDEYGYGGDVSKVDAKYQSFYKNIEKYGGSNKAMVVAVLTAYKDNDEYTKEEDYSDNECTDEEIANGECIEIMEDNIVQYSKSKMKKFIKEVANAIGGSTKIEKGDYKDRDTGSDFFWWLYDDFIEKYYSEYLNNKSDNFEQKKQEIIDFIYLYYEELAKNSGFLNKKANASCPNGVTVSGEGTFALEDYVAGVVSHEAYPDGGAEALKAQAIAARTYVLYQTSNCTKAIGNSQNSQTFSKTPNDESINAANDTAGMVLTYNNELFSAMYDSFCYMDLDCPDSIKNPDGTFSVTYTKLPNLETHKITLNDARQYSRVLSGKGHARGMSQLVSYQMAKNGSTYNDILKYFYSNGVEISTIGAVFAGNTSLPVDVKDNNWMVKVSRGYQVGTAKCYENGKYTGRSNCNHLGIDFGLSVSTGDPIYAIADGVVITAGISNVGYGKYIMLGHDLDNDNKYEYYTLYAHQNELLVQENERVAGGTQIGKMGSTGNSTGTHLHFELRTCESSNCRIDPTDTLNNIISGNGIS